MVHHSVSDGKILEMIKKISLQRQQQPSLNPKLVVIEFNFKNAIKYSFNNVYSITCHDQINEYVQQVFYFNYEERLNMAMRHAIDLPEKEEVETYVFP